MLLYDYYIYIVFSVIVQIKIVNVWNKFVVKEKKLFYFLYSINGEINCFNDINVCCVVCINFFFGY